MWSVFHVLPKNRQADLASSVDIWVEPRSPTIRSDCSYIRRLCGIVSRELDREFEIPKLIRRIWGAYYQSAHMAYVDITARNGKGEIRSPLDLAQLASDPEDRLIRHEVVNAVR